MTEPFACYQHELDKRLRELQKQLNDILGFKDQRLRFSPRKRGRSPNHEKRELQGKASLDQTMPQGMACRIHRADARQTSVYLGYSENWTYAGGRAKSVRYRYRSSNIRFLFMYEAKPVTTLQVRLEWAGREDSDRNSQSGTLMFPGRGAAQPHWHIDLHELFATQARERNGQLSEIDLEPVTPTEEVDLKDAGAAAAPIQPPLLPWFHKLHLAARAMWHMEPEGEHSDPQRHQHEPASGSEIDTWVLSAIVYVRDEISKYT